MRLVEAEAALARVQAEATHCRAELEASQVSRLVTGGRADRWLEGWVAGWVGEGVNEVEGGSLAAGSQAQEDALARAA